MSKQIPTMEQMLEAGLHFGHLARRWHPNMEPFIYTIRNGIHIIDLKKTASKLESATDFIEKMVEAGGDVLFVGTKSQAQPIIEEAAKAVGMPYVKGRWLGGTITNFSEINKSIKHYLNLSKQKETGEWKKYTKKEQVVLQKELDKLHETVSGLANLSKIPRAIFVVDINHEKTAVKEATKKKIPVVAICDTNTNPQIIQYPIPGNDDATRGIELVVSSVKNAIEEGLKKRKVVVGQRTDMGKRKGIIKKIFKKTIKNKQEN